MIINGAKMCIRKVAKNNTDYLKIKKMTMKVFIDRDEKSKNAKNIKPRVGRSNCLKVRKAES